MQGRGRAGTGKGRAGTCARPTLLAPPALLHAKDLAASLGRDEKGTNKLGDITGSRGGKERDVGRGLGEQNSQAWGGLQGSSQQQQQQQFTPWPLHTPGWGPTNPQLSSTLLFFLQDARGWEIGREAERPVHEDSGLLGELTVVAVSEVKLFQVPRALPALRAPHPAVIALQIFLPLPLLLRLFSSLHLVGWGWGSTG